MLRLSQYGNASESERREPFTSPHLSKLWTTSSWLYGLSVDWFVKLQHYPPAHIRQIADMPFMPLFHTVQLADSELPDMARALTHLPWFSAPLVSRLAYEQAKQSYCEQLNACRSASESRAQRLEEDVQAMQQHVDELIGQWEDADRCRLHEADVAQELQCKVERQSAEVDTVIGQWQAAEGRADEAEEKLCKEAKLAADRGAAIAAAESRWRLATIRQAGLQEKVDGQQRELLLATCKQTELEARLAGQQKELETTRQEEKENSAKRQKMEQQVTALRQKVTAVQNAAEAEGRAAARRTKHNAANRLRQTKQAKWERQQIERQLNEERTIVEAQRDKWKCKVCIDREVSVVLMPCNHLSLCSVCATQLSLKQQDRSWELVAGAVLRCPICQQPTQRGETIFVP